MAPNHVGEFDRTCDLTNDPAILVIGSQSILGSFDETQLPPEAMRSIEADIA